MLAALTDAPVSIIPRLPPILGPGIHTTLIHYFTILLHNIPVHSRTIRGTIVLKTKPVFSQLDRKNICRKYSRAIVSTWCSYTANGNVRVETKDPPHSFAFSALTGPPCILTGPNTLPTPPPLASQVSTLGLNSANSMTSSSLPTLQLTAVNNSGLITAPSTGIYTPSPAVLTATALPQPLALPQVQNNAILFDQILANAAHAYQTQLALTGKDC